VAGVFISGTDTGCGKTTVARGLAHGLSAKGLRIRVLKPIETGCEPGEPPLALDARALASAAHDERDPRAICPYALALPAAPAVAARAAGVSIELSRLDAAFQQALECGDLVLVEGAGGLLVPVTDALDMLGLCLRWQLPLVIVARARLGTINHTLLSLREAESRGAQVLGVILNHTEPELSTPDRENLSWLREHCPVPILGELEFGSRVDEGDAGSGGQAGAARFGTTGGIQDGVHESAHGGRDLAAAIEQLARL